MLTYFCTLIAYKLIRYCRRKKKVHVISVYEEGGPGHVQQMIVST